jgi:hypothetical protein
MPLRFFSIARAARDEGARELSWQGDPGRAPGGLWAAGRNAERLHASSRGHRPGHNPRDADRAEYATPFGRRRASAHTEQGFVEIRLPAASFR